MAAFFNIKHHDNRINNKGDYPLGATTEEIILFDGLHKQGRCGRATVYHNYL